MLATVTLAEHVREHERMGVHEVEGVAAVLDVAPLHDAVFERLEIMPVDFFLHVAVNRLSGAAKMQIGRVRGIDRVLHRLEPVAIENRMKTNLSDPVLSRHHVVIGEERRRLRSHVREEKPGDFLHRIGAEPDAVFKAALGRLGRLLDALALGIEHPAVVSAANVVPLDFSIKKRSAAMRAIFLYQTILAILAFV